jgi:hypothetical protein
VVGAGLYGCVIALDLAYAGHRVDLVERHGGILEGATRANQGRLHRGFHYPRDPATALAARADAELFEARFDGALDRTGRHYYVVAADGSKTSPEEYLAFAERLGGRPVDPPPWLHNVAACVAVDEPMIDIRRLRARLHRDLMKAGVTIHLHKPVAVGYEHLRHDLIVMATYGQPWPWDRLRYQVCETALVELGEHYAGCGVVVMDGEFISVDPMPGTDLHMLYDVVHSVHHVAVGRPEVPDHLVPLLDRGPVPTWHTHVGAMLGNARRFLAGVGLPRYAGSMFAVRAVLADAEETDARPTLVREDDRTVWVLPGKLDGCVTAAGRVVAIAAERAGVAVPA